MSKSDHSDAAIAIGDYEPVRSSDVDDDNTRGLVRRYEQSFADIDQRLKDIVLLLGAMRKDLADERAEREQLERDFVAHRKYVDELAMKRAKKARTK